MSDTSLGYSLAIAALLLFTTAILVTKAASSRISLNLGFLIATSTNVGFSALVFVVQWALRSERLQWNSQAFLLFAAAGAFATYLGRWFFYESVVRFGPAKASIFQVSSPLFTALMAWMLLGERLTILIASGMVMTIGGLLLVSCKPGLFKRLKPHAKAEPALPVTAMVVRLTLRETLLESVLLLGLISSLAYAIGNVLRGSAVRSWPEPILGALVGAVCGLALHLAFTPGKRDIFTRLCSANKSGVLLYGLIGVVTISAQISMIASMRYIPLSVATLITLCTPVLVFPLSHWFMKSQEKITVTTLLGGILTMSGIFIIVMR